MSHWLFIAILLMLPIIWLVLHQAAARKHMRLYSLHKKRRDYHAVTIHPSSTACEQVKALVGQRFLADEVTLLPVAGCTSKECTCIFAHHEDRRRGIDRRLSISTLQNVFSEKEQRVRPDRRKQGFAW